MLIDQRGDVLSKTTWWTSDAIAGELKLNADDTFYVKHGNFIALAASGAALLSFIGLLILSLIRRLGTPPASPYTRFSSVAMLCSSNYDSLYCFCYHVSTCCRKLPRRPGPRLPG